MNCYIRLMINTTHLKTCRIAVGPLKKGTYRCTERAMCGLKLKLYGEGSASGKTIVFHLNGGRPKICKCAAIVLDVWPHT